jgi:hypothetical protein
MQVFPALSAVLPALSAVISQLIGSLANPRMISRFFRRRPAWNGVERRFASGITPSASKEHPLMNNTMPSIEYALEDRTDYTDSAFLVTALHWAN